MSVAQLTVSKYCLDTSVISLMLNGELWKCAPVNLMSARPNLAAVYSKCGLEDVAKHDSELDRSMKAYQWTTLHSQDVRMLAPPTASFELTRSHQVSLILVCFFVFVVGM